MNTSIAGSVVVGIDGSAAARHAAQWAASEAAARGLPLRLVTALGEGDTVDGAGDRELEMHYAETCLRDASAAVAETGRPVRLDTAVLPGAPAASLIEQSRDADMVVVGSAGIGRIAQAILGSTAADVAAKAHCPVAVIRHHPDQDPLPRWVAVAVDARGDDGATIESALREARIHRVPLLVVGVWERDFGETPYDDLDRRVADLKQRFPDVHIQPVATRADLTEYLAANSETGGLAVLPQPAVGRLRDIVGPHTHPLHGHGECSVLVTR